MISEDMKVWNDYWLSTHGALEDFCKLVSARAAAAEREQCALLCEKIEWSAEGQFFAKAIRARGK